jgi:hypothetical protein
MVHDDKGALRINLPKLCLEMGYPPTPENLRTAEKCMREALAEMFAGVPVVVWEDEVAKHVRN